MSQYSPTALSSAADSDSALQVLIGQYVNVTTSAARFSTYFGELRAVFADAIVVHNAQPFAATAGEVLIYKQSLVSVLPVDRPLTDEELLELERLQAVQEVQA